MTISTKLYLSFGAVLAMVVVLFAIHLAAVPRLRFSMNGN
jgi:hypothetical protein